MSMFACCVVSFDRAERKLIRFTSHSNLKLRSKTRTFFCGHFDRHRIIRRHRENSKLNQGFFQKQTLIRDNRIFKRDIVIDHKQNIQTQRVVKPTDNVQSNTHKHRMLKFRTGPQDICVVAPGTHPQAHQRIGWAQRA